MNALNGVDNNIPVRMIYVDTKEEVTYKSIAYAARMTGVSAGRIVNALSPIKKKRFKYNDRDIVFRSVKNKL